MKTTETKTIPIAELTPEQFNSRFPVGTRVTVQETRRTVEAVTSRPAKEGPMCTVIPIKGSDFTWSIGVVRPIVTLGSLNVGDEFRWHDETPGAGVYRVKSKRASQHIVEVSFVGAVLYSAGRRADTLVQVIALNLAQDRPEVFPGTMLRDGDVVEFAPGEHGEKEVRVLNHFGPFVFKDGVLLDSSGDDGWIHDDAWNFRLVPATIPAPAPTEPCPAPEIEWCERCAESFDPSERGEHPTETMCASCWDKYTDEVAAEYGLDKCPECKQPWNQYRTPHETGNVMERDVCGDCMGMRTETKAKPPKPPRKLSPAVAYHIDDDCDASGLPRWN